MPRTNRSGLTKNEYDRQYQKQFIRNINIQLHKLKDIDILNKLAQQPNISAYIKSLIRNDI